jgi:hypothetical protein
MTAGKGIAKTQLNAVKTPGEGSKGIAAFFVGEEIDEKKGSSFLIAFFSQRK